MLKSPFLSIHHYQMSPNKSTSIQRLMTVHHQSFDSDDLIQKELLRRSNHSAIEKKRREKMSVAFNRLKDLTPSSKSQQYIQKLTILENAVSYIEYLQSQLDRLIDNPSASVEPAPPSPIFSDHGSVGSIESSRSATMEIRNLLC